MSCSVKKSYLPAAFLISLLILVQLYVFGRSYVSKKIKKVEDIYVKSVTYECGTYNKVPPEQLVQGIKFRLYIISHDSKSHSIALDWSRCKPWARVVRIPTSHYFESIVYKEVLPHMSDEWEELDFVGIATYRSLKFAPLEKIKAYLELAHYKPYDVIPLYTAGEYMMQQAVAGHTIQFMHVWDSLLNTMGYNSSAIRGSDRAEVFLRNSMIIRPKWLKRLSQFMISAMNVVDSNETIRNEFATDAHYKESIYRKAVAQRVFHTDYYQWHPFVFERLPVFYFNHYNASVYGMLRETEWFDFSNSESIFKGL